MRYLHFQQWRHDDVALSNGALLFLGEETALAGGVGVLCGVTGICAARTFWESGMAAR